MAQVRRFFSLFHWNGLLLVCFLSQSTRDMSAVRGNSRSPNSRRNLALLLFPSCHNLEDSLRADLSVDEPAMINDTLRLTAIQLLQIQIQILPPIPIHPVRQLVHYVDI